MDFWPRTVYLVKRVRDFLGTARTSIYLDSPRVYAAAMRRCVLVAVVLLGAACSSGGAKPAASASTATTVTEAGAEAALRLQVQQLSDGQFGLMYDTLHPAQQAVLSKDRFVACYRKIAPAGTITDVKVKTHYSESVLIPGTSQHADSTAITTSFKVGGGTASTATFHEFNVDGTWRWTFDAVAECP